MSLKSLLFFVSILFFITGCGDSIRDFLDRADLEEGVSESPSILLIHEYRSDFHAGVGNVRAQDVGSGFSIDAKLGVADQRVSHVSGYGAEFTVSESQTVRQE